MHSLLASSIQSPKLGHPRSYDTHIAISPTVQRWTTTPTTKKSHANTSISAAPLHVSDMRGAALYRALHRRRPHPTPIGVGPTVTPCSPTRRRSTISHRNLAAWRRERKPNTTRIHVDPHQLYPAPNEWRRSTTIPNTHLGRTIKHDTREDTVQAQRQHETLNQRYFSKECFVESP